MKKVLHNSYTMCTRGSPDICTLGYRACGPQASGVYIRQATRAHGITIIYTTLTLKIKGNQRSKETTGVYMIYPIVMATGVRYIPSSWQRNIYSKYILSSWQ